MGYDDEYYCPNCGANLNDQYGFDPDKGTWTCTNCGEHLMDDDVYEGDTFEGVAWYCDDCGALLNRQDGFSDSYGSWTCTNCGHVNGTTEDDIINGGPECPSCGAKLKEQWSYNEWSNDHTCTDCGANLHRDYSSDDFEVVEEVEEDDSLKCPNCSSRLKDQWGYSEYDDDWTCTECNTRLHHDYSSEEYEVVEEAEDDDDSEDTTYGSYNASSGSYTYSDHFYRHSESSHSDSGAPHRTTTESSSESPGFKCPSCGSNLSKQYNFDYRNEEYTCKVCHTLLFHYYTDEAFKIKRERARSSSDTPSHSTTSSHSTPPRTSSHTSSSYRKIKNGPNEWLLFLVCLFFGYFGVHKFMEGKTGMGILYIFTVGLFGIGWMVDCCKTFMNAVKSLFN